MLLWLKLFLMILSYICATMELSESSCKKEFDIRSTIGKNVSIICNLPTTCTRGTWRRQNTWFVPPLCDDCGDSFTVTNNLPLGINILHINNVSENHAGMYYCECEYLGYKTNVIERDTVACFNFTTHLPDCQMHVAVNDDIFTISGSFHEDTRETIDVHVDDRIEIRCQYGAQKRTDCSPTETDSAVAINQSVRKCKISCISSKDDITCKIKIILNVSPLNMLIPTVTTSTTKTFPSITTRNLGTTPLLAAPDAFQSTVLINWSTPKSPIIASDEMDEPSSTSESLPSDAKVTIHESTTSTDFKSNSTVDTYKRINVFGTPRTSTQSLTLQEEGDPLTPTSFINSSSPDVTSIIIKSCAILFATITGFLICLHIPLCRIGIHVNRDKEENIKPVCETSDNGIHLRCVTQLASYQYESSHGGVSETCSTSSSVSKGVLNPNQIMQMAKSVVDRSSDPLDTLGHGVTSFRDPFADASHTRCTQDDTCQKTLLSNV